MDIKGIFHGTGERDTGKTIWALGAYPLKQTAYIYDDVKKFNIEGYNSDEVKKEFGLFLDLTEKYPVTKVKELEFAQSVMAEIDKISSGKYQSIVFDTWTRFGKSLRRYAKANPHLFREKEAFTNQVAIRHAEEWGQASVVEKNYIATLANKSEALFLVTHITPIYKGGVATDLYEPDCGKAFDTACNMRLWFKHNPSGGGVPISLVIKRLPRITLNKKTGMIEPVNILPRKMTPRQDEYSVWDCINRYWNNPVGNRKPTEDEIPTENELAILDGVLTPGQREMWQAELREKQRQEVEEKQLFNLQWNEIATKAKALGLPAPLALPKLQSEYPDLTLEELGEMLR